MRVKILRNLSKKLCDGLGKKLEDCAEGAEIDVSNEEAEQLVGADPPLAALLEDEAAPKSVHGVPRGHRAAQQEAPPK